MSAGPPRVQLGLAASRNDEQNSEGTKKALTASAYCPSWAGCETTKPQKVRLTKKGTRGSAAVGNRAQGDERITCTGMDIGAIHRGILSAPSATSDLLTDGLREIRSRRPHQAGYLKVSCFAAVPIPTVSKQLLQSQFPQYLSDSN